MIDILNERPFPLADELQVAMATSDFSYVSVRPVRNCKKCYGRGYLGYDTIRKRYVACKCLRKGI